MILRPSAPRGRPGRDPILAQYGYAFRMQGVSLRKIHNWLNKEAGLNLAEPSRVQKPYYKDARRYCDAGERIMRDAVKSFLPYLEKVVRDIELANAPLTDGRKRHGTGRNRKVKDARKR